MFIYVVYVNHLNIIARNDFDDDRVTRECVNSFMSLYVDF